MQRIPVLVSIRSNAHRDEAAEDETMTMLTSGELDMDERRAVLHYEETIDESLPPQKVDVTVEDDCVIMTRFGDYATQMVFRLNGRYEGRYLTPYGEMQLAVYCTRLDYDLSEEGGSVLLGYQLDLNGSFAAMHDLELNLLAKDRHEK